MTLDGDKRRVEVPVTVPGDRNDYGLIIELRMYWSMWLLASAPPTLLELDAGLGEPEVVQDDQRALTAATPRWGH